MTIEQTNKVDIIGQNKKEGYVALTISDHLEWDDKNLKLQTLQNKINCYLAFIESGQLFEEYPSAEGEEIRIHLHCMHKPNEEGMKFISLISPIIEGAGFKFTWEMHNDN